MFVIPISQVMKLKLSGVTSPVWGQSAVKQKRWNLNQAHLSSEHSALSHHAGQIVKEEYIWNEDNIKVTQALKASIPIHVSINKLIILWLSRQSEKNDQLSDLCGKNIKLEFINLMPLNMCLLNIFKSLKDNM